MLSWLLVAFGAVLVFDALLRAAYLPLVVRRLEQRPPSGALPGGSAALQDDAEAAELAARSSEVAIATPEEFTLRGRLYRPLDGGFGERHRGLIVFCPELDGSCEQALHYARGLLDAGYAVLAVDVRSHGQSDIDKRHVPLHWPTTRERNDIEAVLTWVARHPYWSEVPLGLFGISRGGALALCAAARCPAVSAVACDGAYSMQELSLHYLLRSARRLLPRTLQVALPQWHLRGTLWIGRMISGLRRGVAYANVERACDQLRGRPVLLIAGADDNAVPAEISEVLQFRVGVCCDSWVVPHARHNQARQVDPAGYDARLVEFFSAALAPVEDMDAVASLPRWTEPARPTALSATGAA